MFVSTELDRMGPMGDGARAERNHRINRGTTFALLETFGWGGAMTNVLDIIIIFTLAIMIVAGFFGGFTRLVAMAISVYLGSVAATRWYVDLAKLAHRHISHFSVATGQFLMFAGMIVVSTMILTPIIARSFVVIRFPRRWEIADNVAGAGVGLVAMALSAVPMSLVLQALNQSVLNAGDGTSLGRVHNQIEQSALMPVFLRMAPVFVHLISPWFPGGLPPILSAVR
jgi:uncharacterized membrane protein required for colicin V production